MLVQLARWTDPIEVVASHGIGRSVVEYARCRVSELLPRDPEPPQQVKVRLTRLRGRVAYRYLAQANLDLAGRPLRVQVAAAGARAAVDELCTALQAHLATALEHPHGGPVTHRGRPSYAERRALRRIVRRKEISLKVRTVDGAACDIAALGHDFTFFTEAGSGQPSVLSMTADGAQLEQAYPHPERVVHGALQLHPHIAAAPRLTEEEAVDALERTHARHLFFIDQPSGGSRVLYRRYDGHYGLLLTTT